MALLVRPPTAKQKFYQRRVMVDLPVQTWLKHVDPLLPQPSTKLGIARSTYSPMGHMFGKLLPTSTTKSGTEKYCYRLPPGRITSIQAIFRAALKAQYGRGAIDCSKVKKISKDKAARGVLARHMSTVVGPVEIRHAHLPCRTQHVCTTQRRR